MTADLTIRLTGTLSGLKLGLPITALNRLRRRDEEQQKMTDARETILWRLATARARATEMVKDPDLQTVATTGTIRAIMAYQLALVTDCAAEIRQRDATIAELRGRVAALEAMTPGGVR